MRVLTAEMETNPFPDAERRAELAKELGMDRKRCVLLSCRRILL